jgi:predicted RND superfamily exporter protein
MQLMDRFLQTILRYRIAVLLVITVITLFFGAVMTRGIVASTIGGLFLNESPEYHRYLERVADFGSDDLLVVAIEYPGPLAPDLLDRLERAVAVIREMALVRDVRSALDVQQLRGNDDSLTITDYAELLRERPSTTAALTAELAMDPLARDLLLSRKGDHLAVIVELDATTDRPAEKTPELIDSVLDAFTAAGFPPGCLRVVGMPASIAAVMDQTYFSIRRLFPIVAVVLLAAVWIMFRRLWPVAITGLVAFLAVVWTMGFSILLDRHISVFTGMMPAMILIISFSDVIHLCSAYLLELAAGKAKKDAILACGREVGRACLFTSVTTFAGFVSLSLIPTPATRILGVALGFGTASALLLAVTLAPILFTFMPVPKRWRRGTAGRVQDWLDRFLEGSAAITSRHPRIIVAAFGLVLAVVLVGALQFRIETDFSKRMAVHHPIRVDGRFFRAHFAGANTVDIFIEARERDGLLEPVCMRRVAGFQREVAKLPEVAKVYSLVDLLRQLHHALVPGAPPRHGLPDTRQALGQYLLLFEMSGGEDLERLVDSERRVMRMTLYLPKEEYRHTAAVGAQVRRLADEILGDAVTVEVSGLVYLLGSHFEEVLKGQQRALVVVYAVIALMMMIGLRSVKVGLWSMLPNVLPLLVLFGCVGLFTDAIDSDILIVTIVAIGIGVDDTIHFLMRLRIESGRARSRQEALSRTFYYSGRGIAITTLILVVGFAPFALSDYLTIFMFGSLLPLTLVSALVADLYLVPALSTLGLVRFPSPQKKQGFQGG